MRHAIVFLLALHSTVYAAELTIKKLDGAIAIDGDISDSGWKNALRIDDFVEFFKGDNTAPPARTTAWLTYDDRYFYVAFRNDDPNPKAIRAPFVDRDQVLPDQDYVTVMLDTQNDRRSVQVFRVNPRGVQTDSILDDASGNEDFAPDFFYETAAKITAVGWTAEMRIPLASLRYPDRDPQTWGVILSRNYPRDFRYIMAGNRFPKGRNCFVCYATALHGLTGLPRGGHVTVAPYSTAAREEQWTGARLSAEPLRSNSGADFKWSASPKLTIDATLNPDFSQIESDVPQVSVNSRFALSYPEKRAFFLDGVDLLSTPLKIVYTRSITSPAWGIRATGQSGSTAYTVLAAEDRGGGAVVLPGAEGSSLANQDFRSLAVIGRARTSIGDSFAGLLFSAREVQGGGHNRVIGPDFLWKLTGADRLRGQVVFSQTENPSSFDARSGNGHAMRFVYTRDKNRYDIWSQYFDYSPRFRADNGFVPWADVHGTDFEIGGHVYPTKGFASFIRPFVGGGKEAAWRGGYFGFYLEGKLGTSGWISYHPAEQDRVRGVFTRQYKFTEVHLKATPSMLLPTVTLDGSFGDRVDYMNVRIGRGGSFTLTSSIRPTTHLELATSINREWLDVANSRLYAADIDRVKATYVFNARSLARVVAQRSNVDRTARLYTSAVSPRDGNLTLSALYGYRLNWQTTFFIGFGDFRLLDETERMLPNHRLLFMKASYAFQR
ncbi:MAG TPA: DUF5916 domain-containing protein [Thermoanaerobaculia bacterium]|nr:DUF5916 domain-containing protein [Thermoanaerobaculia bacterium]